MITDIHKARLLKLADFLAQLPPDRFNFATWVGDTEWQQGLLAQGCGTTACALGWATAIPEFAELGLVIVKGWQEDKHGVPAHVRLKGDDQGDFWQATLAATRHVFGMDELETNLLFTPTECESEEEDDQSPSEGFEDGRLPRDASAWAVAEHIRQFVKECSLPDYPG